AARSSSTTSPIPPSATPSPRPGSPARCASTRTRCGWRSSSKRCATIYDASEMTTLLQRAARFAGRLSRRASEQGRLAAARRYLPLRPGSIAKVGPYRVRTNDGPNLYVLYKDLFIRRVYHFEAERSDPRILDCGSNIGLSVLYFKS